MTVEPIVADGLVRLVCAAERTGLLAALDRPATPEQLAARLSLDARAVALALGALVALRYVAERDGRYVRAELAGPLRDSCEGVEAFLRTGQVSSGIDDRDARGKSYGRSVLSLGERLAPSARELAEQLGEVATILDVGAGSGVWSLAMAERSPHTRVLALDLPEVVPCVRVLADGLALGDRVELCAGDYFAVDPPGPFERVVLANVLHLEEEAAAAALIARYAASLADDGELVVVDWLGGDGRQRELATAVYALHLCMRTARGKPHELARVRAWCEAAGLCDQRFIALDRSGAALGALVCRRAEAKRAAAAPATTTLPTAELEALRREVVLGESRQRLVFEGSSDALMVVRYAQDRIVSVNAAFCALFALDWGPADVHDYRDVVAAEDRARFAALVAALGRGEIGERRQRFTMLRGGTVPFAAEISCYEPSHRSSALFAVRDRGAMARQEKREALGALVAGVTHDLNTPLGVVASNAAVARTIGRRLAVAAAHPDRDEVLLGRMAAALDGATADLERACERIEALVRSLGGFAQLEGPELRQLADRFGSGVARAICERIAAEAER